MVVFIVAYIDVCGWGWNRKGEGRWEKRRLRTRNKMHSSHCPSPSLPVITHLYISSSDYYILLPLHLLCRAVSNRNPPLGKRYACVSISLACRCSYSCAIVVTKERERKLPSEGNREERSRGDETRRDEGTR